MGDGDGGGADMAVELEAGLNADRDPTSEFVTQGEKKGTGHVWTCVCCQGTFNGHKCKLTVHIAGKKFLNDKQMDVRPCTPPAMIKQGNEFVPNTEQQALLKRARPLLLKYIQQEDETPAQKQGLRSFAKVLQEKERESSRSFSETPYLTPVLTEPADP